MALAPSLFLIIGSSVQWLLDRRAIRASRYVPIGAAILSLLGVILLDVAVTRAALWVPLELFGPGFEFRLDNTTWPFVLLATGQLIAAILRQMGTLSPLYLMTWGVGIAAILASNVLTAAVLWTVLASAEVMICLKANAKLEHLLIRIWSNVAAVVLVLAFALSGAGTQMPPDGMLLALAVVLRTLPITPGPLESRGTPHASLAGLTALVALSTAARQIAAVEQLEGLIAIGGLGLLLSMASWVARPSIQWTLPQGLVCAGLLIAGLSAGEHWRTFATVAAVISIGRGLLLHGDRAWRPRRWAAAIATGLLPLGFPSPSPWSLERIFAALAVAVLVLGILGVPDKDPDARRQDRAIWELAVLIVCAFYVVVRIGFAPEGVVAGAVGVALGSLGALGIARFRERMALTIQVNEALAGLEKSLSALWETVAQAIRSVTGLLEGQSAVLWMFLALLTAAIVLRIGSR